MTKFEYNPTSHVAMRQAKQARTVVYGVRAAVAGIPVVGAFLLIMLAPPAVWIPTLCVVGFFGTLFTILVRGQDIYDWYDDKRTDYQNAQEYGVRDE